VYRDKKVHHHPVHVDESVLNKNTPYDQGVCHNHNNNMNEGVYMKQGGSGFFLCVGVENGIPMIQEFKLVGGGPQTFTAKELANLKHVTKLVPETNTPRIKNIIEEVE
jgi:hypothetical protein